MGQVSREEGGGVGSSHLLPFSQVGILTSLCQPGDLEALTLSPPPTQSAVGIITDMHYSALTVYQD